MISSDGSIVFGTGAIRANDIDYGEMRERDDDRPYKRRHVDWSPVKDWENTTIGALLDLPDRVRAKNGKSQMSSANMSRTEIAFIAINNLRGVNRDTPCQVSARGDRNLAIVIGGKEYRLRNYVLGTYEQFARRFAA